MVRQKVLKFSLKLSIFRKGASKSSSAVKKKWEDNLDDLTTTKDEEVWDDAKHGKSGVFNLKDILFLGGVPKPPMQYLKEFRRP